MSGQAEASAGAEGRQGRRQEVTPPRTDDDTGKCPHCGGKNGDHAGNCPAARLR
jgi:hypothetical protein